MKDYEAYVNNGNIEIPEYSKELKIEYFDLRNNDLPGEEMDSFENSLACGIGGKSKSFQAQNQGKPLEDVQELANAVTPSSGSIVETVGGAVTGTATVVVGASAAVIAFNAVPKSLPKMKINNIESGSSFVHYNLEAMNLDTDKDYDIVVSNVYHTFKIECTPGLNDEYVYNLKPGLQYSLTLVGYSELLGTVEYQSESFFTLDSDSIVGYSNIKVIYNDDLTCGIKYDTTLVDDNDTIEDSYIVIRCAMEEFQGEEMILFHSLYQDDFNSDNEITYSYDNKVHRGTIGLVPAGTIYIDLYKKNPDGDEFEGELVATTEKEVIYPLIIQNGSNYVEFSGEYELIKDIKNINVKKDNLVVKMSLYNDNNEETIIEKNIDISNSKFNYRSLVKHDTKAYSYKLGYYKADNSFIVIKESEKVDFLGGYYDAYYYRVMPNDESRINVEWKYDFDGSEICDMTLHTDFNNYGNNDAYYRVELLRIDYETVGEGDQYIVIDTFEGTGDAVFKNVEIGEFDFANGWYDETYRYTFRYTSLMRFYKNDNEKEIVALETYEPTGDAGLVALEPSVVLPNADFELLSSGKFALNLFIEEGRENNNIRIDEDNIKLTMYFYEQYINEITDTIVVNNPTLYKKTDEMAMIIIDEELPVNVLGYYAEYEVPYYEKYGGNMRLLKTNGMLHMGEVKPKIAPVFTSRVLQGSYSNMSIYFRYYMPDDYKVSLGTGGYYIEKDEETGYFVYSAGECNEGDAFNFSIFDNEDVLVADSAYIFWVEDDPEILSNIEIVDLQDSNFIKDNVLITYNADGTINVNLLAHTKLYNQDIVGFNITYSLRQEASGGGYYGSCDITDDGTSSIINFNNSLAYRELVKDKEYAIEIRMESQNVDGATLPLDMNEYYILFSYKSSNSFALDDLSTYSNQEELRANVIEVDGNNYIELRVPKNAVYDKNQTIEFTGSDNGDELTPYTMVLSDATIIEDGDELVYRFSVPTAFYDVVTSGQGSANLNIMYNYSLTEEKLQQFGNNYEGNLYDKLSISISLG